MCAIYSFEVAAWFNTFGEIGVNVKFAHEFTLDSQIHENVKFARISYEFVRISCEFRANSYQSAPILSCHCYLLHTLDIEQFVL